MMRYAAGWMSITSTEGTTRVSIVPVSETARKLANLNGLALVCSKNSCIEEKDDVDDVIVASLESIVTVITGDESFVIINISEGRFYIFWVGII